MNKIYKADEVFINEMKNDTQEPMAKIAGNFIRGKQILEKTGLPTKKFSGMGSDPTQKLKELVYSDRKLMKKPQDGGFIPILAPLAVGALTAIGSKITSELYDFIKKEI